MINIKLPDGSIKEYEEGVNALQVAKSIAPSLAKPLLVSISMVIYMMLSIQ